MKQAKNYIVAIDLRRRRFGYAVLDGPERLVEYGAGEIWMSNKERSTLKSNRLLSVLRISSPDAVVVRKSENKGSLDFALREQLFRQIKRYAMASSIPLTTINLKEIRRAFGLPRAASKYKVVPTIVRKFPKLHLKPPASRKAWEPEPHSTIIFDAIAAGLAHLQPHGIDE